MKNVNLTEGQTMQVLRYANRVPLQFQPAACAITQSVIATNWRAYGLAQSRGQLPVGPITVMVCSFGAEDAAIVRLYGRARIMPLSDSPLADLLLEQPAEDIKLPTRQVIEVQIENTMTRRLFPVFPAAHPVIPRETVD